jgi:hypothetical protein
LKRNLLVAAATSSMLAVVPSLAVAQGRHHHQGARHANAHKKHGHRAHLLTFGTGATGPTSGAPTTGTPSSGAATVVSFTEGTLTIELTSDKSLIKGKVTDQTRLECRPAAGTTGGSDEPQGGDDQQQGGVDQQQGGADQDGSAGGDQDGPPSQAPGSGQQGAMAHSSDVGDDQGQGDEEDEQESCTTAALQAKAVVLRAELRIGDNGTAEWEQIELQK